MQRLSNNFFTHAGTIGVRGVDEIDSQLDSTTQNPNGLRPICGLAPNSISRDAHRAESKARNAKITSDQELARLFRGRLVSFICGLIWHRPSLFTMRMMTTAVLRWSKATQAALQKSTFTDCARNAPPHAYILVREV